MMAEAGSTIELCSKSDLGDGEAIKVEAEGLELAVYRVGGEYFVTDNMCTHGPGELSDGYLEGYEIECDFHQGKFDIRTGAVTAPPCLLALKTYKVVPHDSAVVIEAPGA